MAAAGSRPAPLKPNSAEKALRSEEVNQKAARRKKEGHGQENEPSLKHLHPLKKRERPSKGSPQPGRGTLASGPYLEVEPTDGGASAELPYGWKEVVDEKTQP